MAYAAPPVCLALHGYSRRNVQTQAAATNDIATLADSSQNNAYALGVAGLVAPYIGIAILGFLIFFFVFSSACCCPVCCRSRCKACRPRVAPEKEGLATRILCQATAAQTCFALCALLVVFLGAGAVSWSRSLGAGFNFTFQAVINFANILALTNSSIGGPLLDAAYGINASVGVINDRLVVNGVFSANSSSGISDIQKGTNTLFSLTTLATSLLSPIISMIRTTGSGTLPAANASYATAGTVFGQLIGGALFGLPMLIVGIAALVACTVRPRRGCCGTCAGNCLACCLCPLLVLILVLWFFGALFFGIAVVGSDFCYDPPAVVLSLLGSGSAIYPTAKYYVSPCGSVAVEGVFSSLQKMLLEAVSTARSSVVKLNETVLANPAAQNDPQLIQALGTLGGSVNSLAVAINGTLDTLDCPTFYSGLWLPLLDGLCTQTVQSFATVWQIMTAFAVFLVLLGMIGTYIVCWRPGCGGPMDEEEEGDHGHSAPYGGSHASVAPAPIIVLQAPPYDPYASYPGVAPPPELPPVRAPSRSGMPGKSDAPPDSQLAAPSPAEPENPTPAPGADELPPKLHE